MDQYKDSFVFGLTLLGGFTLAKFVYKSAKAFMKYKVCYRSNLLKRYGGDGIWAVITGATDGIGKQYALQLAAQGFNIVLVARDDRKLQSVSQEITSMFRGVRTATVIFDFTCLSNDEQVSRLEALLSAACTGKDIAVLVNNVGIVKRDTMATAASQSVLNQITVNINSQAIMTRYFVPQMIQRPHKSLIIDVSSVAAFGAATLFPIYAATKAFNLSLCRSVAAGHKDKIECMAVTPDCTATNMNSGTNLFSVNADTHVSCVLNQIGWTQQTYGHWLHAAKPYIVAFPLIGYVTARINNQRYEKWLRAQELIKQMNK